MVILFSAFGSKDLVLWKRYYNVYLNCNVYTVASIFMTRDMFFSNINISPNRLANENVKTTIMSAFWFK